MLRNDGAAGRRRTNVSRNATERHERTSSRRLFDFVNTYFDHAAAFSEHPAGLLNQIKACNSIYRFNFPFRKADGILT